MIAFVTLTVTPPSETLAVSPFQDSVNECKLRSLDAIRGLTPHDRMIAIYITSSNLPTANMTSRSSFICLSKAFKLSLVAYTGGIVGGILMWGSILLSLRTLSSFPLLLALFALVSAIAIHLGQWGLWSLILKVLWSDPPRWARPAPWQKQPLHFAVGLIAILPVTILILSRVGFVELLHTRSDWDRVIELAFQYYWVWMLFAAATYYPLKRWLD